ncbi:hypothetical protein AGMMS49992_12180 [Clostridia bacterium]|nr:hypothetical protein AGMMS49992_12180 [Clostridia bacterium]
MAKDETEMRIKCAASPFCGGCFEGCIECAFFAMDPSQVDRDGMHDAWMLIEECDNDDVQQD